MAALDSIILAAILVVVCAVYWDVRGMKAEMKRLTAPSTHEWALDGATQSAGRAWSLLHRQRKADADTLQDDAAYIRDLMDTFGTPPLESELAPDAEDDWHAAKEEKTFDD